MAEATEPMVEVRGLQKAFGSQVVLDGIDLDVKQGESVAVLGRSGTGKSVLLKLLIRLQQADGGVIRVAGEEIERIPQNALNAIRKRIGMLFQHGALYDSLTVEQNVLFPLQRHERDLPESEQHERVQKLLERVGMAEHAKKYPAQISGGMQKRVALARALVLAPSLLLCDEPTAGLDPMASREIGSLIQQMQRENNMAAIVVTHDIHGAVTFSDRIAMLNNGRIVAQGTGEELRANPDPFVQGFFQDLPDHTRS